MSTKNRFTVQLLGIVDAESYEKLQARILATLAQYPAFQLKTLNLDCWIDGVTGQVRQFDDDGNELARNVASSDSAASE